MCKRRLPPIGCVATPITGAVTPRGTARVTRPSDMVHPPARGHGAAPRPPGLTDLGPRVRGPEHDRPAALALPAPDVNFTIFS